MASHLADWALIVGVIALIIAVFCGMLSFIDQLIDYWRAYRDHH